MSSSNNNNSVSGRTFKATLTSTRTLDRSPLTPRLAPNASHSTPPIGTRSTPINTPRLKQSQDAGDIEIVLEGGNITPRSAKRRSRVESSNNTPTSTLEHANVARATTISPLALSGESIASLNGMSLRRPSTSRSPLSESAVPRAHAPFTRSLTTTGKDGSVDSRFFHASDIGRVDTEVKRPEPRTTASFVYADGQQEQQKSRGSTRTTSPARSEKRLSSIWPCPSVEDAAGARSPPMLSPALSGLSSISPFFASAAQMASQKPRSPSPSKENIHLSYRKGVSQIFGSRPSPISIPRTEPTEQRPSLQRTINSHKKSPSLSSIDSGQSRTPRRRSNTAQDTQCSSPLRGEAAQDTQTSRPSIDTKLDPPATAESGLMSPSMSISDLAADARRERKVLDLEISNSSLLAINASLERDMRRQKTELKRFRRFTRAGCFSANSMSERRSSGSLGPLDDALDGRDSYFGEFGRASGLSELYSDMSDSDEDGSLASGLNGERKVDRLAKNERRLRADLDKHRELLVQGQMMNQSLRRCMYTTEEMIKEGKKAVDYKVRVSDVKLGGRILTGHEEEDADGHAIEELEIEDEYDHLSVASPMSHTGVDDHAQGFIDLWGGIGKLGNRQNSAGWPSIERSDLGDRDSGIEVDKPV